MLLEVRVIEAQVTVRLADGTVRHEQWRLLTSLLDPIRYPADQLVRLYHDRWQAETTYFSIKATMLDGRVLRSRSIDGLDQEVYALLTAYQALIRAAADAAGTQPGLDMDRISFTVLLQSAADQVITAGNILTPVRPTWSARSDGPSWTHSCPPGAAPGSRPAPARTPPANTARTPDNTPRPARPTPSTPTSCSSNTDLHPGHDGKRNRVIPLAIFGGPGGVSPSALY